MAILIKYALEDLRNYVISFFTRLNVPPADAEIAADVLLAADLRGVDSHGIIPSTPIMATDSARV